MVTGFSTDCVKNTMDDNKDISELSYAILYWQKNCNQLFYKRIKEREAAVVLVFWITSLARKITNTFPFCEDVSPQNQRHNAVSIFTSFNILKKIF